jgi:hypothetical protein
MKLIRYTSLFVFITTLITGCSEEGSQQKNYLPTQSQEYATDDSTNVSTQWVVMPFDQVYSPQEVQVNGQYLIIEGDIIAGYAMDTNSQKHLFESAIDPSQLWDRGIIPYTIEQGHHQTSEILQAIKELNDRTNLKLVKKKKKHGDYIRFIEPQYGECSSWIGRQHGLQDILIRNCSVGSIKHEILHAAGFFHEHTRSDREEYVTINYENIESYFQSNFNKYIESYPNGQDLGPYDYGSIMHYEAYHFSKNNEITIKVKSPPARTDQVIGQRDKLSELDIEAINKIYPN